MNKEERIKAAEAYSEYGFIQNTDEFDDIKAAFLAGAEAEAESIRMTRVEIQQLFDNKSDCKTTYLDGDYEADAMSKNRFVELIYAMFGKPTP